VATLLASNSLSGGHYAEPFAGGAGIAWRLLFSGNVSEIWLNDLDPAVFAFWDSVVNHSDAICDRILKARFTMTEWRRQRSIFRESGAAVVDRGFATLYMNRTNRSGILDGGVIGGNQQNGNYKIDCRFNKDGLIQKIQRIARYRGMVHLSNEDARLSIARWERQLPTRSLINIDPPYFGKGGELYTNYFKAKDHAALAQQIRRLRRPWMLSYDHVPEIVTLYAGHPSYRMSLLYSAQVKRMGAELLVLSRKLTAPSQLNGAAAA
jgi:DNA adenine methylase